MTSAGPDPAVVRVPPVRLSLTELLRAHERGVSVGVLAELTGRTHLWTEDQLTRCGRLRPRCERTT